MPPTELDRHLAAAGLGHHGQALLDRQQVRQPRPQHGMIVDEHQPDRRLAGQWSHSAIEP